VSRGLASNLMPRGSAPSKTTISHTSRKNQKIEETSYLSKKTYRSHGEDQLVERAMRTHQPVLLGIAAATSSSSPASLPASKVAAHGVQVSSRA
jgi:hypothetical protein